MAILDLNGNPIGTTPDPTPGVIVEPIDQIPPIPDDALRAVLGQCNAAFHQGAQPNQPIGVDIGLLASLARTVRDLRNALVKEAVADSDEKESNTHRDKVDEPGDGE